MKEKFNSLSWHDAILAKVVIDRRDKRDIIQVIVSWPETIENDLCCIEFYDCYAYESNMNFGVVPPDFILEADCTLDSDEISFIKKKWRSLTSKIEDLMCFSIHTNSTNSSLKIYSLGFRILDWENSPKVADL
jgi:hypothetical protein